MHIGLVFFPLLFHKIEFKMAEWRLCLHLFVVNGITEEANPTIYSGKVIRPLRGVDPTQIEYQGMIEIVEEGKHIHDTVKSAMPSVST